MLETVGSHTVEVQKNEATTWLGVERLDYRAVCIRCGAEGFSDDTYVQALANFRLLAAPKSAGGFYLRPCQGS